MSFPRTPSDISNCWLLHKTDSICSNSCSRVFPNISVIGFDPLPIVQHLFQYQPEDLNIWPISAWKRTGYVNAISRFDAGSKLISEAGTLKLVAVKSFADCRIHFRCVTLALLRRLTVNAMNIDEAVASLVILFSLLPLNLSENKERP